tara:strand:+ start:64 stop:213 length:150 start_codon:yes stop_codon:yes gene_type:complete
MKEVRASIIEGVTLILAIGVWIICIPLIVLALLFERFVLGKTNKSSRDA